MERCLYVCWKGLEIAGNLSMYALYTVCNQQVRGSSPFTSSKLGGPARQEGRTSLVQNCIIYGGVPEWPKGADCKSVVDDFSGSNPLSPTIDKVSHETCGTFVVCSQIILERFSTLGGERSKLEHRKLFCSIAY